MITFSGTKDVPWFPEVVGCELVTHYEYGYNPVLGRKEFLCYAVLWADGGYILDLWFPQEGILDS